MSLNSLMSKAEKALKNNSPAILSAIGVSGTITTAYLASKASFKAAPIIYRHEAEAGTPEDLKERLVERTKIVWRLYIPAGISGGVTVFSIIAATRVGNRRTAAVTAAYSLSERAYSEYRDQVIEQFGESKDRTIRDKVAQKRLDENPPEETHVIVAGSGDVLCCELWTGRYFTSDMETIRRAQNDLNAILLSRDEATLSDFYHMIGLPNTVSASVYGWTSDKLLELEWSTAISTDKRPCMTFAYNYVKPL